MDVVGQTQFEQQVINASHHGPVVVDFWASWCGPCRVLGPVLDRVVTSYGGKMTLVKINVEEPANESLSTAFNIRGIPAVKIFHKGVVAREFVGALPESEIRKHLNAVMPSEADEWVNQARARQQQGELGESETLLRKALTASPSHAGANLELARILVGKRQLDEARESLSRVGMEHAREYEEAQGILARLEFMAACQQNGPAEELEKKIAADPNDLEARMRLGHCLAAREHYPEAMEQYLAVMKRNKRFEDESPRKSMLRIFSILGQRHPLVEDYRKRMASILYS